VEHHVLVKLDTILQKTSNKLFIIHSIGILYIIGLIDWSYDNISI